MSNHDSLDEKQLAEFLLAHDFDRASIYLQGHVERDDTARILHMVAEDHAGLLVYTFACYELEKSSSKFWHKVAGMLAYETIQTDHSNSVAVYHLSRAIELDPADVSLKSYALNLYNTGAMSDEKAKEYAEAILKAIPDDTTAKSVLSKVS